LVVTRVIMTKCLENGTLSVTMKMYKLQVALRYERIVEQRERRAGV